MPESRELGGLREHHDIHAACVFRAGFVEGRGVQHHEGDVESSGIHPTTLHPGHGW